MPTEISNQHVLAVLLRDICIARLYTIHVYV